jgi:hypothetical protein
LADTNKKDSNQMSIKTTHKFVIAGIVILALIWGGLQFWLWKTPLVVLGSSTPGGEIFDMNTAVGRVFAEVQECGEQQKNLYLYIEAYREKNDRLPDNMDELINDIPKSMSWTKCPSKPTGYKVHFENYGKPDAVFIEEAKNMHSTAFKLWIRGIKPCVQTMGDGTIHLFEGGKLATIQAHKSKNK